MKNTLKPGDRHVFSFTVHDGKTVPELYPESAIFRSMPRVFATGYMVGLMEWACTEHLKDHLDEGEGSLGIAVNVDHTAPTLPGQTVTVEVECLSVDGRILAWKVLARDELDVIGQGTHTRAVVRWDKFGAKLEEKRGRL